MGGIFQSEPKVEAIDTTAIAEEEARKEREKILERQRRGMEGTINTSYTGILKEKDDSIARKKLLGE